MTSFPEAPPLSRRRGKEIASLAQRKYRQQLGAFLVEGVRAVASALEAGAPLTELVVAESARGEASVRALVEAASEAGVPVYGASDREAARLSAVETSQGVLAVARLDAAPPAALHAADRVLVLDGVQDPGNVGTLMRTAAWFGAGGVLAGPGTADLYHPKVVRAAMGGHWDLRLARTDDLGPALDGLRAAGFTCYGADLGGTDAARWRPAVRSALVLGSEAHGLSPEVQERLAERVTIPGHPHRRGTESLNVAVAAGILLYAWLAAG